MSAELKRYVWIVEMWIGGQWQPTAGCGLTRDDARREAKEWLHNNKHDAFRVRKYSAMESSK